ncbi:MAG: hypothetical protein MJK07_23270 [Flavobacteriales bacterium]|nr:hypothetical protein [Flavobacteriales bacterium]
MKYTLFFVISLLLPSLFSGCNSVLEDNTHYTPEEHLESVVKSPIIKPGIGIGYLEIEKTRGEDLFNEEVIGGVYSDLNIYLQYRNGDTLTGITIKDDKVYKTADGKTIGMNEKDFIKEFGQPTSKGTPYRKGEKLVETVPTLNYDGLSIWYRNSTERTIFIFK